MNSLELKKQKGFTLLELLIVIAIIGVLSTVLMANFIGIRERSRDGQRKSDLRQIQSAVELFRSDEGRYPNTIKNCQYEKLGLGIPGACNATIYLRRTPDDPLIGTASNLYNSGSYYYTLTGTTGYRLVACLENENDNDPNTLSTAPTPAPGGTCASGKYYVLRDL